MDVKSIDFAGSELEKVEISYNQIDLLIFFENAEKEASWEMTLHCYDVLGLDSLVMWEEAIISKLNIVNVDKNSEFIKRVYSDRLKDLEHDSQSLMKPIKDLQITLLNGTTFHIYCQSIGISETKWNVLE